MDKDKKSSTDEKKVRLIQAAYDDFIAEVKEIEKKRDERIMKIIKQIENSRIEDLRTSIKS